MKALIIIISSQYYKFGLVGQGVSHELPDLVSLILLDISTQTHCSKYNLQRLYIAPLAMHFSTYKGWLGTLSINNPQLYGCYTTGAIEKEYIGITKQWVNSSIANYVMILLGCRYEHFLQILQDIYGKPSLYIILSSNKVL